MFYEHISYILQYWAKILFPLYKEDKEREIEREKRKDRRVDGCIHRIINIHVDRQIEG